MNTPWKKYYNIWTVLLAVAVLLVLYLAVLYPWMNRWGATDAEVNMPLPGDGTDPGALSTSTRGVTIHAPSNEVWKWVVQLGQDRAGFYSHDWLENLVLSDIHNGGQIRPEWQQHQKGDAILGAGGAVYQRGQFWPTKAYEAGKMLYLWGPIVVLPVDGQTSRLILRTFAPPTNLAMQLSYDWMHFVMERGLLLGIKARAEGTLNSDGALQILANTGWILAALGMAAALFMRRRNWGWGLLPLAYAAAILAFTADLWSALAGFLWWGVIAAGFILYGRGWWKGLALATAIVVLIFVLAPQPHLTFGILFLAAALGTLTVKIAAKNQWAAARETARL